MTMHKDRAMDIAQGADDLSLGELLEAYAEFQEVVVNTPDWFCAGESRPGKSIAWQQGLHGAIGLCTEAAEILDAYKKEMYGKQRPIRPDNIKEECGDIIFYLLVVMRAYNISFHDALKDNIVKLANRYIERFEV